MPSPSPTTTRAVKLKRRPPFTTLATRLIATTRSTYALFSTAPSRRPSRRSRRSPPPAPVPRRWGPGIRSSSSQYERSSAQTSLAPSERQPALASALCERSHPAVVTVAATVEHDSVDPRGLGARRDQLTDLAGFGGLVATERAQLGLHR